MNPKILYSLQGTIGKSQLQYSPTWEITPLDDSTELLLLEILTHMGAKIKSKSRKKQLYASSETLRMLYSDIIERMNKSLLRLK
jgi:hypothetical protein